MTTTRQIVASPSEQGDTYRSRLDHKREKFDSIVKHHYYDD
jgi:hypothetical protein